MLHQPVESRQSRAFGHLKYPGIMRYVHKLSGPFAIEPMNGLETEEKYGFNQAVGHLMGFTADC